MLTFSDEARFYLNGKIVYHMLVVVFVVQKSLRKFGNMRLLKVNISVLLRSLTLLAPFFY